MQYVCKEVQQIIKEKFQNSEYFVMVVVGSWSKTERIYPLYNITRLDGLRQMRADYKKFDTTWEKRKEKNTLFDRTSSIKISDVQQKGNFFSHFSKQSIIIPKHLNFREIHSTVLQMCMGLLHTQYLHTYKGNPFHFLQPSQQQPRFL